MAWRSLVLLFVLVVVLPVSLAADSISKVFNYPNPYDPATGDTNIVFKYDRPGSLPFDLTFHLHIYNLLGQRVLHRQRTVTITVANDTVSLTWNGKTDRGDAVPPGVYYIRIVTEGGAGSAQSLSKYGKLLVK